MYVYKSTKWPQVSCDSSSFWDVEFNRLRVELVDDESSDRSFMLAFDCLDVTLDATLEARLLLHDAERWS